MDKDVIMDKDNEPNDASDSDQLFHTPTEIDNDMSSTTTLDSDVVHHEKPKPKGYSLKTKVTTGSSDDVASTNSVHRMRRW